MLAGAVWSMIERIISPASAAVAAVRTSNPLRVKALMQRSAVWFVILSMDLRLFLAVALLRPALFPVSSRMALSATDCDNVSSAEEPLLAEDKFLDLLDLALEDLVGLDHVGDGLARV